MIVTSPMVLPPDILVIPSADLDEATRIKCGCTEGYFVLTRPNSRVPSSVVNEAVINLLNQFRKPTTIVEASIKIFLSQGGAPEAVLEDVYSALKPFIKERWLVPSGAHDAGAIEPSLSVGASFGQYTVSHCVQVLEDSEVYQLKCMSGELAALKIEREGASVGIAATFEHEELILRTIDGWPGPRLLEVGKLIDRNFIVTDWCSGVWVSTAAGDIRRLSTTDQPFKLLKLCNQITRAYATLHHRGILHGDIHPKNILVDRAGAVSLVDFGLARKVSDSAIEDRFRRGVPEYFEPELAKQILLGQSRTPSTLAGEQYSIAALLYLLVCGEPYLDFAAYKEDALRQIADQDPIPFAERGVMIWPKFESILFKALSKNPAERFDSVKDLSAALQELESLEFLESNFSTSTRYSLRPSVLPLNLSHLDSDLTLDPHTPICSVSFGAAGVAYALYCLASMQCDARYLALADAWACRSERTIYEPGAFTSETLQVDQSSIGDGSLWFGRPGVYLVKGLVSHALGDQISVWRAIEAYKDACHAETKGHDLTIGTAGKLLGCALLIDAMGFEEDSERVQNPTQEILTLGQSLEIDLYTHLAQEEEEDDYLGIAHGTAGKCYAALIWSETSGRPLPITIETTLDKLFNYAQDMGRGVRFPVRRNQSSSFMESWCHGTPGYIHLWAAAYRAFHKTTYMQVLERCAWTTWDSEGLGNSLCCGDAGRGYAFLSAWRHTGDRAWLVKAEAIADRALKYSVSDQGLIYALYKGKLGVTVLAHDLQTPSEATMPLFERDIRGGSIRNGLISR